PDDARLTAAPAGLTRFTVSAPPSTLIGTTPFGCGRLTVMRLAPVLHSKLASCAVERSNSPRMAPVLHLTAHGMFSAIWASRRWRRAAMNQSNLALHLCVPVARSSLTSGDVLGCSM